MGKYYEVRISYPWEGSFDMDDTLHAAAGRDSSFSGCSGCARDLGWWCKTEAEANEVRDKLATVTSERGIEIRACEEQGDA